MHLRRCLAIAAGIAVATLVACGGSSTPSPRTSPAASTASASAHASASSTPSLDSCVVGSWKTTGVTGTVKLNEAVTLQLTGGGAGAVITVAQDGTFKEDYGGDTPWTGDGSDGGTYEVSFTGTVNGTLVASDGQASLTLLSSSNATQTVSKDGTQVGQVQAQPGTEQDTYTCTANAALSVTSPDGTTTNAVPA